MIKVWREDKVLLTEVQLAESLNSVCFLDQRGHLLVGFKNHIFFIHSSKGARAFCLAICSVCSELLLVLVAC